MTDSTGNLTHEDVQRLLSDPSSANRATTAAKIAATFVSGKLDQEEKLLAEEIFRLMANDVEVKVREALAESLHLSPELPRDIALILAKDVESVSLPVVQFSEILSDQDLIDLVKQASEKKQKAIAQRAHISAALSEEIIAHAVSEEVTLDLAANEGAEISEAGLEKAARKYPHSRNFADKMVERQNLPVSVSAKLVQLVSQHLRETVLQKHRLPAQIATDLLIEARDKALVDLMPMGGGEDNLPELIRELRASGQLTPTLILRALCMGDIGFFEAAMAELANIPVVNAQTLIHDQGELGLASLYRHSQLPGNLFPAIHVALEMAKETIRDDQAYDRVRYRQKMIERVLTKYGDLGEDNVKYLVDKLNRLAA